MRLEELHASSQPLEVGRVHGYGTSEGVSKEWDTRGRGRKRQSDKLREQDNPNVLGYDLDRTTLTPIRHAIPTRTAGQDHGADPIGDGTFRMVPSGDIVDLAERNKRLEKGSVRSSADFIGPGSVQTDKDKPATEEEQKNIGDKRSKEFAAASPLRSFQELFDESLATNAPSAVNWEVLRWLTEGSGNKPVFGNPPKKLWNGRLQSGG